MPLQILMVAVLLYVLLLLLLLRMLFVTMVMLLLLLLMLLVLSLSLLPLLPLIFAMMGVLGLLCLGLAWSTADSMLAIVIMLAIDVIVDGSMPSCSRWMLLDVNRIAIVIDAGLALDGGCLILLAPSRWRLAAECSNLLCITSIRWLL